MLALTGLFDCSRIAKLAYCCVRAISSHHYTSKLKVSDYDPSTSVPIYRLLANDGRLVAGAEEPDLSSDLLTSMYKKMAMLNEMDKVLIESQRQGRISFYMTSYGEEATTVGSAAALNNCDLILAQYRELGVLLWRDFPIQQVLDQCFGNCDDRGKGKQMPVLYGSPELNFVTMSSPLSTQMPQASGAAYAYKLAGNGSCVVCYFGDGASSEGDAHAAFNFAAVLNCPVIFFCRNNGYAISTKTDEQFKGDGLAGRAMGYGISSIRLDGNDVLGVYKATEAARQIVASENRPVIIEAMTYRISDHSTSDDSTTYRPAQEILDMKNRNPITRFGIFLTDKGLWDDDQELQWRKHIRKLTLEALTKAERKPKQPYQEMFTDVYHDVPPNLQEQLEQCQVYVEKYRHEYPA
jgi:2-oxoisovalerate dehydrogenase E1 component alpha subunit